MMKRIKKAPKRTRLKEDKPSQKNHATTGIAEFKAKLSSYIRRVKSGEQIEILERGIPVALLHPARKDSPLEIVAPRKNPLHIGQYKFSVHPAKKFDVVEMLLEDRKKR